MRTELAVPLTLVLLVCAFMAGMDVGYRKSDGQKVVLLGEGKGFYCQAEATSQKCPDEDPVYSIQVCVKGYRRTLRDELGRFRSARADAR